MPDLLVCRMCLAMNTRMYVVSNTPLQEIYEKNTNIPLQTDESKPAMACYICHHHLKKFQGFIEKSVKADKILKQVLDSGFEVSVLSIDSIDKSYLPSCLEVSTPCLTSVPESQEDDVSLKNEYVEVKIENFGAEEEAMEFTVPVDPDSPLMYIENPGVEDPGVEDPGVEDPGVEDLGVEQPGVDDSDESDDSEPLKAKAKYPEPSKAEHNVEPPKVQDDVKPKKKMIRKVVRSRKPRGKKKEGEQTKGGRPPSAPRADAREVTLTKEEQLKEVMERVNSSNYRTSRFKCDLCFRGFRDTMTFGKHMARHDKRLRFECEICHLRYNSNNNLRSHVAKAHEKRYVCNKCEHQSMTTHEARTHDKWHAGHRYECKHCGMTYSKKTTYMSHVRIKHVSDFVCELCGFTFVSEKGIEIHKMRSHQPAEKAMPLEGPHCAECGVTFLSESAHARHLEHSSRHSTDKDPKRLRNDMQVLNTKKRRLELKLEQVEENPDQEPITCEQCDLRLANLAMYGAHFRRAHPGLNRTKYSKMNTTACMCEHCGKMCQSKAVLDSHMWVHTGTRRHKCPECSRSYVNKISLSQHMQIHSKTGVKKTYDCPICGKSFSLYSNRRRHILTHTGVKAFHCESCGKAFTTEASKKAHMEHVHLKKPRPKRIRRPRQKIGLEREN